MNLFSQTIPDLSINWASFGVKIAKQTTASIAAGDPAAAALVAAVANHAIDVVGFWCMPVAAAGTVNLRSGSAGAEITEPWAMVNTIGPLGGLVWPPNALLIPYCSTASGAALFLRNAGASPAIFTAHVLYKERPLAA